MTSINIKGRLFDLSTPVVMGILNSTPDSFYDGGEYNTIKSGIERAKTILDEGANIIDIGGYSSRPGSSDISEEEEINRVVPLIKEIKTQFPSSTISIDTFRRKVAEAACIEGADIINDISGGELDVTMFDFIVETKIPYCMMHMKGTPQNMQENTLYNHLINDILNYFNEKISSLKSKGVHDIIIDPGFGFSKTIDQNYELLKNLNVFHFLDKPILCGFSRKSMVYKLLNIKSNDALTGTIALNMFSLQKGASILRVHDVKEAVETITLFNKLH